jgi:hypothetical protein
VNVEPTELIVVGAVVAQYGVEPLVDHAFIVLGIEE